MVSVYLFNVHRGHNKIRSLFLSVVCALIILFLPIEFAVDRDSCKYNNCLTVNFALGTGVEWQKSDGDKGYVHLIGDTPFKYGYDRLFGADNRFLCDAEYIGNGYLGKFSEVGVFPVYKVKKAIY